MSALNPRTRLLLTLGLIVLILVLFAALVDLQAVWTQLRRANWRFAFGAVGMLLLGLGLYALRWQMLLTHRAPLPEVFHAANIGHMINILVPLRAGEAARVAAISRGPGVPLSMSASSVAVERWLEQLMRLTALGGAIVLGGGRQVSSGTILGGLASIVLALVVMTALVKGRTKVVAHGARWLSRLPRVAEARARDGLAGFLEGLSGVASARRLAVACLWSILTWLCFLGFHYLTLRALPVTFASLQLLAVSLGSLALAPPSAPTQPGIYHASVVAPLGLLGYSPASITAYAVLLHGLQMVVMISLGTWGVGRLGTAGRRASPGKTA